MARKAGKAGHKAASWEKWEPTGKKRGRKRFGRGLYLQVRPSENKDKPNARSWIFHYQLNGGVREMGLGSAGRSDGRNEPGAHVVTLKQAAAQVDEARGLLAKKIDPLDERRKQRGALLPRVTFAEATERYCQLHQKEWKSAKHGRQFQKSLIDHAGAINNMAVSDIETSHVLKVLEPIWNTKTETAARLRGRIEMILDSCKVQDLRSGENPARWKGHLAALLPSRSKVRTVKHHRALDIDLVPVFMTALAADDSVAARALEFTILTATRSGEVLGAQWSEIDFDKALWTIPAERMKSRRKHQVPLSARALGLLREPHAPEFVFGGPQPLSHMAMHDVLKRMDQDCTTHGFRSSFRDWAGEKTHAANHVVEMALAHAVGGVEGAYRRGDLLEHRRKLMDEWARYCSSGAAVASNVAAAA